MPSYQRLLDDFARGKTTLLVNLFTTLWEIVNERPSLFFEIITDVGDLLPRTGDYRCCALIGRDETMHKRMAKVDKRNVLVMSKSQFARLNDRSEDRFRKTRLFSVFIGIRASFSHRFLARPSASLPVVRFP